MSDSIPPDGFPVEPAAELDDWKPASPDESRAALRRRRRRRGRFVIGGAILLVLAIAGSAVALSSSSGGGNSNAATTATTSGKATSGKASSHKGTSNKATSNKATTRAASKAIALTTNVHTDVGVMPMRTATTKGGAIDIFSEPSSPLPIKSLSAKTEYDIPRSFLAFDQYQDWLHVYIPARPNSSTGWIKASDVTLSDPITWTIKVSLADHKLTLLHNGTFVFDTPAAIGTPDDPTPTGTFFYTDPLDLATNPGTAYGVFAIGLSGHSNVLTSFAGSDGQIAIHGTNDPGNIGNNVSHGCVRVSNDVILKLSKLPIGTLAVIT